MKFSICLNFTNGNTFQMRSQKDLKDSWFKNIAPFDTNSLELVFIKGFLMMTGKYRRARCSVIWLKRNVNFLLCYILRNTHPHCNLPMNRTSERGKALWFNPVYQWPLVSKGSPYHLRTAVIRAECWVRGLLGNLRLSCQLSHNEAHLKL